MLGPRSEDYVEVVAGKGFQPTEDHSLGFFHSLDPLHGPVICPEDELSLRQIVSPLPHEVNCREDLPFIGGIVGLSCIEFLGAIQDHPLQSFLDLG